MKRFILIAALLVTTPVYAGSSELLGMYKGYEADSQSALTQPHRSVTELGNWLSDRVADSLQFTPGKSVAKLNAIKPDFSEQGYAAYAAFLNGLGLTFSLQNQSLNLSTIVTAMPVLIGQGASAGRYAWMFELPVVITIGGSTPVTKEATLRLQVGRSAAATNAHGVLIENWTEFKVPPPAGATEESSGQIQAQP